MLDLSTIKIAVVGLGYVGLPLALEFSKKRSVIGFDTNEKRINELLQGNDTTLEVSKKSLSSPENIEFTSNEQKLHDCNCFIITVPTPIDSQNNPDTKYLEDATTTVGKFLSSGDLVIYESTVYPGMTEEICVPILEKVSGLKYNDNFFCGYSPERINPGDKKHKIVDIVKVTSGSNYETALFVDTLYKDIITAGTFMAESIRVAEAAKVIENTQRDINISLINELAIIFKKMNIDTEAVLKAAETKWNFLSFRPGLVGGHCIGVDPYYLTFKAKTLGHYPKMILGGREINEAMPAYVVNQLIKKMITSSIHVENSKILLMGIAFKENCPDIRNSKVGTIFYELKGLGADVKVYDPWVSNIEAKKEFEIDLLKTPMNNEYDAILLCVKHDIFSKLGADKIRMFGKKKHILFDLKYVFSKDDTDIRI